MGINLTTNYSINFTNQKRHKKIIKFIIIHYTGMKNDKSAIKRLCEAKSKVSAHYFLKRSGEILNLVPDLFEAWHAGKSNWKNYKSLNKYSIGIEISNPGHEHGYIRFNQRQISSIIKLLNYLVKKYKIIPKNVLGHSDIAPYRKKDPGEKFPWNKLSKYKLCQWHSLKEKNIKKFRGKKTSSKQKKDFFKNLDKIGYKININKKIFVIRAFQRRYRQTMVNGKIDQECFLISKNLVKP